MRGDSPAASPSSPQFGAELEPPSGPLLFLPLLLIQGGGMDLSSIGEKILSSVRTARSLGLIPTAPQPERPEVPPRAAAAAAAARALAGLPPHQRINLPSSSEDLVSIYGSNPRGPTVEDLEESFYEEDFDPVRYILDNIPSEENDTTYFEKQCTMRLAQLDKIAERLSAHVTEHHEEMVKGMQLVMEMEHDLKVASVICMNGRRYVTSAKHEVSRDLLVNNISKKKQALLDILPIISELRHALDIQMELDTLVEEGKYCQAFQLLPEYLQILENYAGLSAIYEMGRGIEAWLSRTIQKLDSHLLGICQEFNREGYITAVDAYALMGDIGGMTEKMQSYFLQELLSETHAVLKELLEEDSGSKMQNSRLTYSDLCALIPESKFRLCLLRTLDCLFTLMCSYYSVMSFSPNEKDSEMQVLTTDMQNSSKSHLTLMEAEIERSPAGPDGAALDCSSSPSDVCHLDATTSGRYSPFYKLRKDATSFVSHTLERGRRNIWQLTTSRLSVLLSCPTVHLNSTHQFLRNYEDLNVFILAGEAFCGFEATEFRHKLKIVCAEYVASFHRQDLNALKMVLEKESWASMSAEASHAVSLSGLTGDSVATIAPARGSPTTSAHYQISGKQKNGFSSWLDIENPFSTKVESGFKDSAKSDLVDCSPTADGFFYGSSRDPSDGKSVSNHSSNHRNSPSSSFEEENEDLLADFIDEDSQLPSRISKTKHGKSYSSQWKDEEISSQTGSSLSLLRMMDKYARLMQKLSIVNIELFKGMTQLFGIFYFHVYETFGQLDRTQSNKATPEYQSSRLRAALVKITQDCDIRSSNNFSPSPPLSFNTTITHMDVMPTAPPTSVLTSFGIKERCVATETLQLVARILNRSKAHLQSLLQNNASVLEDFFGLLVQSVPDLVENIHRTSAHMFLHISGYADKIVNAKWEVKELGLEHNGYVDLLLGEFKHYKTRLTHGGVPKELQELLLEYGVDIISETLVEGLSRVKRCTDEGRALMSLDLQVLINGLRHLLSANVRPKMQIVETFIKAYYLPETEYVHWARSHPEYSKNQIVGLVNLVATMKAWKRKTKLEVLEKIESLP